MNVDDLPRYTDTLIRARFPHWFDASKYRPLNRSELEQQKRVEKMLQNAKKSVDKRRY